MRADSGPLQTTVVVQKGSISDKKRHWRLWIDLVRLCGGHLRKRAGETLDFGELGICLGSVVIQQVKIDVSARGFQLRGDSGVPDGTGVVVT